MKRITLSLMTIATVALLSVSATGAYFVDIEEIKGNTFAAGSLDLVLGDSQTLPFSLSNLKPGDEDTGTVTLTNAGTLDGKLTINWTATSDSENGILEPEAQQYPRPLGGDGLTTADSSATWGELDIFMRFAMYVDVDKSGSFNSGDVQLATPYPPVVHPGHDSGKLYWSSFTSHHEGVSGFNTKTWTNVVTIPAGQSVDLVIPWKFPTETGDNNYHQNMAMTDGMEFDMTFTLNQL